MGLEVFVAFVSWSGLVSWSGWYGLHVLDGCWGLVLYLDPVNWLSWSDSLVLEGFGGPVS